MLKVSNMFRVFSMESVIGYHELSNVYKSIFDETYKSHLSSIDMEKRKHYLEYNIVEIVPEINMLKVYFRNDECFIYSKDKWEEVTSDKASYFNVGDLRRK